HVQRPAIPQELLDVGALAPLWSEHVCYPVVSKKLQDLGSGLRRRSRGCRGLGIGHLQQCVNHEALDLAAVMLQDFDWALEVLALQPGGYIPQGVSPPRSAAANSAVSRFRAPSCA